jgi:hypothetical protein
LLRPKAWREKISHQAYMASTPLSQLWLKNLKPKMLWRTRSVRHSILGFGYA